MTKIGILGCGYNCSDKLDERLNPWFKLTKQHNFIFSFVSVRFKEYEDLNIKQDNTDTSNKLTKYWDNGQIQYLTIPEIALSEAEARNLALNPLLSNNCDIIWLLDLSDEYYTEQQINNIIEYINKGENSFESWFSIPMKNYILDGKQWISGFCPPRIFRVNPIGDLIYKLDSFYWDNDIQYKDPNGLVKNYKQFSHKKIPDDLLNGGICHLTWLHSNGKNKVAYQLAHFGHSSYKWNEEKQELEIDYDFYRKIGQNPPIIYHD